MAKKVHMFDTEMRARVFAAGKNALSRKYSWIVKKGPKGGWAVTNVPKR